MISRKGIYLIWGLVCHYCTFFAVAETPIVKNQTTPVRHYFAINGTWNSLLETQPFITGEHRINNAYAYSLKYEFGFRETNRFYSMYGDPRFGVGFYRANLHRSRQIGSPLSVFLYHNGGFFQPFDRLWLRYEVDLGLNFNMHPYDRESNPDNHSIGTRRNLHLGLSLFLEWRLADHVGLRAGYSFTHFSNGALRMPNMGINMIGPYVELICNPGRVAAAAPVHSRSHQLWRMDYDLSVICSSRQLPYWQSDSNLKSPYVDHNYPVVGLSFAALAVPSEKFKWGLASDIVYDESVNARAFGVTRDDGSYYDRIVLSPLSDRFTFGFSLKGEYTLPRVSFFANAGYNFWHKSTRDSRFYQIVGVKLYLFRQIFGTFGVRASRFQQAQYFYFSLGYTFRGKSFTGCNR